MLLDFGSFGGSIIPAILLVGTLFWIWTFLAIATSRSLDEITKIKWLIVVGLTHFLGACIALVYLRPHLNVDIIRPLRSQSDRNTHTNIEDPLKRQYVSGQISLEEYEQRLDAREKLRSQKNQRTHRV